MFAHDVEGFVVDNVGRQDDGFDAAATLETPLSVAEELDEFFLGSVLGVEGLEHAFAHRAIGGFVLSGEQDGLRGEAVL